MSKTEKTPIVDEFAVAARNFLLDVAVAKQSGAEWLETSKEVIDFYNPNGLNGARYFLFQGLKVCEKGKREEIEQELDTPMAERLHGKGEGVENIR